ncbi:MAG: hypothetical protein ACRBBW_17760 [Cellvibrionaceae bacterium]
MRQFIIGIAFTALSLAVFAQQDQEADSILPQLQKTLIEQAQAVALVEVTHVNSLINRALSFPGMLSVEGYSYQLSPYRQWKGHTRVGEELRIDLKDCARSLQKGEKYIVMMSFDGEEWTSKQCEQVVAITEAQQVLAYLDSAYGVRLAQQ